MLSIWQSGINMPEFDSLEKDISTDILIIGGGMCGILTAYMLERAGADYVLVEADGICRKTSAHTTAKITSQHGLIYSKLISRFGERFARLYYEANEDAASELMHIARGIDCDYTPADSYVYSLTENLNMKRELEALIKLKIPTDRVRKTELPFHVAEALKFENQASFNPLKFVANIARGLKIYENTRITEIGGQFAKTERFKISYKRAVIATHFPFLNKHGFYFLKMFQERSYVMAIEGAEKLDGMYLNAENGGLSLRSYGDILLLGGGNHRTGKASCGWDRLEEIRKRYYKGSNVKYKWATQDCITLDGVPYVGRYSKSTENLYVATGFNKWGMTSSMAAAKLLADLLCGKESRFVGIFSPTRSIFRKQLFKNGYEAARGWLGFGKHRCPHLGCALSYNKYEHSWDCSCHGSRFDKNGRLIDNPANSDIESF